LISAFACPMLILLTNAKCHLLKIFTFFCCMSLIYLSFSVLLLLFSKCYGVGFESWHEKITAMKDITAIFSRQDRSTSILKNMFPKNTGELTCVQTHHSNTPPTTLIGEKQFMTQTQKISVLKKCSISLGGRKTQFSHLEKLLRL